MDLELKGRTALVTGADSGMGEAVARLLLAEGARVAITDVAEEALARSAERLGGLGDVFSVAGDVTRLEDVRRVHQAVLERLGAPDILVHAAGITGPTGDFLEIDDAGWLQTLNTNLLGAVRICREVIPAMQAKRWGRIVLFGSEDGVQPYEDELPYCAAKAGVINLAKGLSKAFGGDNILVNTVSPAFIETPMTDAMMRKRADEAGVSVEEAVKSFLEEERPNMVLKRRGRPEEVAAMVVFLCSEKASFVTGSNIRVDSGSVAAI